MAATRKKVAKRAAQPRNLTKAEHHKMFLYIGKARVMAQKMAEDKKEVHSGSPKDITIVRKQAVGTG